MGDKSEIQWTDATWNPVTGCSKVSPGCAHCYAETLTERYAGRPGWITEHRPWTPANAAHNVTLRPERLDQPLRWQRPRMVFVNSMSDLFHEQIPRAFIQQVFSVMASTPEHTFQVLTKRPERMRDLLLSASFVLDVAQGVTGRTMLPLEWPLPNVWLGVSIENRRFVRRADLLRQTPAAVRFISAEPLLGPLLCEEVERQDVFSVPIWSDSYDGEELALDRIDWLIVGGESGPGHRPMRSEWVRKLRDACLDSRCPECFGQRDTRRCSYCACDGGTGTAFFFKQWGGRTPKAGGRELDGRTWDEMPARARV